jgi:hypothetical protein
MNAWSPSGLAIIGIVTVLEQDLPPKIAGINSLIRSTFLQGFVSPHGVSGPKKSANLLLVKVRPG